MIIINKNTREFISTFVISLGIALFINTFIFGFTSVKGVSMEETLIEGDKLFLINYEKFLNIEYKRGDIIVFLSPYEREKGKRYIKRLIGLPGDNINIMDGKVYVNGDLLLEDYIDVNSYTDSNDYGTDYKVPEGKYFFIGDNRNPNKSHDSRDFGAIDKSSVKGKAIFRLFPFDKWGKL